MMNNDLISRSALLKEVNLTFDAFIRDAYFSAACDAMRARNAVNHMLNDAPAVDAVEVVRCKDCRKGKYIDSRTILCASQKLCPTRVEPDFFCADGERKMG